MTAPTPWVHFLTLTRDADGEPILRFECRGDRDAACHRWPEFDSCSCEYADTEENERRREAEERADLAPGEEWTGHRHTFVSHDECHLASWFADGWADAVRYAGPDEDRDSDSGIPADMLQLTPSPITTTFDGEVLSWQWVLDLYGRPVWPDPALPDDPAPSAPGAPPATETTP